MRLRSGRALLAATCVLATTLSGSGLVSATASAQPVPSGTSGGWAGEDKRAERARAAFPEDRYAMAGGCYAVRAAGGGYVERSGEGFTATAESAGAAEPFHFSVCSSTSPPAV